MTGYISAKDRQLLVLITIFFHQASGLVTPRPLDEKSPNSLIHAETGEKDSQKVGVRCLRASWERRAYTHTYPNIGQPHPAHHKRAAQNISPSRAKGEN